MPSRSSLWLALNRELFAVSIDPLTNCEIRRGLLPPGTFIEDPRTVLRDTDSRGAEFVTVRTKDQFGREGLERVNTESLRRALPKLG